MQLLFRASAGGPARSAVRHLLTVCLLVLVAAGCPTPAERPEQSPDEADSAAATQLPVRVLVVDDPQLAEAVRRQWEARTDRTVEIRTASGEEFDPAARLEADVVLFPSGLLGALAEAGRIVALDKQTLEGPQLARRDVFPLLWQTVARWGQETHAAPLGSPVFCLLYRPDVLEAAGEQAPEEWPAYRELGERLAETKPGDWHALAEPLAPGWAGQVLLARAAPYARHRSHYSTLFDFRTMEPLIDGPPFVLALEELVAAFPLAPPESLDWTPSDVRRAFYEGRLAMAITWPSSADEFEVPQQPLPVAFAELPGSPQVYSPGQQRWEPRRDDDPTRIPLLGIAGRLGAVTTEARRPGAAADVLAWIAGRDWSGQISPRSSATTLFRQSHMAQAGAWVSQPAAAAAGDYAELVERTLSRSDALVSVRIPGRARYLAALDDAVRSAVRGEATPQEALSAAADQWRRITDELGLDAQRDAYARSLGLRP